MKITTEQIEAMRERIAPLDTEKVREKYRKGEFARSDMVQDVNKRYRFDLFYFSRAYLVLSDSIEGLKDEHIDTALRRIVPTLGKTYQDGAEYEN